jgi:hypothetical protein
VTFTYDIAQLATPLAQVRLEIGDTDSTRPLLQDEEIQVKLGLRASDVLATAADLCEILATRFAGDYDFKWKDGAFNRSQRAKAYADRAKDLRARSSGGLSTIEATRVDGYTDDVSARDGAGQAPKTGRVRAGYTDPDLPY